MRVKPVGARSQAGERGYGNSIALFNKWAEVKGGRKWRQTALGHRECGGLGDTAPQTLHSWGPHVNSEGIFPSKGNMVNKQIGDPGIQTAWFLVSALSFTNCMTLHKLLDLFCASDAPSVCGLYRYPK